MKLEGSLTVEAAAVMGLVLILIEALLVLGIREYKSDLRAIGNNKPEEINCLRIYKLTETGKDLMDLIKEKGGTEGGS